MRKFIVTLFMLLGVLGTTVLQAQAKSYDTLQGGRGEALISEESDVDVNEKGVISSTMEAQGVTYKWHGYRDGTAEIYEIVCKGDNVRLNIPQEIEGYVVTAVTGNAEGMDIQELTIPEPIKWFGEDTFAHTTIQKLNFHAIDAACEEDFFFCPFARAKVQEFNLGEQVEQIGSYVFYETDFTQENVVLQVPKIGAYAFHSTSFRGVTLGEQVKEMGEQAFGDAEIETLVYSSEKLVLHQVEDVFLAPFARAEIQALEFGEKVLEIPAYLFTYAKIDTEELTLIQNTIGDMAFYNVWNKEKCLKQLTVADTVQFVGDGAFSYNRIDKLNWNANPESNAEYGIFYEADILDMEIGAEVEKLPDYCFANASLHMNEFCLVTPVIGEGCFLNAWTEEGNHSNFVSLEITEEVKQLGARAFGGCKIVSLLYSANADTTSEDGLEGPFSEASLSELIIDDRVEVLSPYLFADMSLLQEKLIIPDSVREIHEGVFSSGWGNQGMKLKYLTIGKGLEFLATSAFEGRAIESIYVDALEANELFHQVFRLHTNEQQLDGYLFLSESQGLPSCSHLYIHKGSDFYPYFEANAEETTIYCPEHMEEVVGETYVNDTTGETLRPTYNTCSICGYQELISEEIVNRDITGKETEQTGNGGGSDDIAEMDDKEKSEKNMAVPIAAGAAGVTAGAGAFCLFLIRRRR